MALGYHIARQAVRWVLRLFYRVECDVRVGDALPQEQAIIFMANHPNGLVDPLLLAGWVGRPVRFLAKAPLFDLPIIGAALKIFRALPVYRRQDDAGKMGANDEVLATAAQALCRGEGLALFPEGRSHSEPQLQPLKTGCARVALDAVRQGARVSVCPVGLYYADKGRFRSYVRIDFGPPLDASTYLAEGALPSADDVKNFTRAMTNALRSVTLNVESWEDVLVLETAEALYSLRLGEEGGSVERYRRFARGMSVLRAWNPSHFEALKAQLMEFRLAWIRAGVSVDAYGVRYSLGGVLRFCASRAAWLLLGLLPSVCGWLAYGIPYWLPGFVARRATRDTDLVATMKIGTALIVVPVWWLLLIGGATAVWGLAGGAAVAVGAPIHAALTWIYWTTWQSTASAVRTFFWSLRERDAMRGLRSEGERLERAIDEVVREVGSRLNQEDVASAT